MADNRNDRDLQIIQSLATVTERLNTVVTRLDDLDKRLTTIESMALKYKGGFIAVLSIGSVIGWLVANGDWIHNFFLGNPPK